MSTIILTDDQRQKIIEDAGGTELLTDAEVEKIASQVNEQVNLPFLGEEQERVVLVKVVRWLDQTLYQMLPNEIYDCIRMAEGGIDEEEADTLKRRIRDGVNNLVNLPFLTENQEQKLFGLVIDIIVGAMKKGNTL